jgi:hypothetical protein
MVKAPICIAAVAAATLVSGASATESTIYPGVGIGKVQLGMTRADVERALGHDYLVNERGSNYLQLGWNFGSWTVELVAKGRTYHVVRVSTTLRSQRTPKGTGPGASWSSVVHAYPGGRCTFKFGGGTFLPEYLVPHPGGTQTLYTFHDVYDARQALVTGERVVEVYVRSPFKPLPEFAPNWRDQCAPGWGNTNVPRLRQG